MHLGLTGALNHLHLTQTSLLSLTRRIHKPWNFQNPSEARVFAANITSKWTRVLLAVCYLAS